LSKQPDQPKACAALGVVLLNKKSYQEAAELLGRAVNLDPDSSEYAMAFAETLLLWKRNNELLGFLKSVEPKFGQLPEFEYKMALAYYGAAKLSDTVATLEKLLRMNPRRKDQIYFMLGNSYLTMGKLVEAEKAYRNAIEMNPKDPAYSEQFAAVLRSEGSDRLEEAIAQLSRARQMDASNAGLALQLALSYESKGDLSSAVGPAEEAVRLKPDVLPAHVALARIYFRLGRRKEGQKEKAIIAELEHAQELRDVKRGTPESVDAKVR
jgi:tetratricopeptide (TPR) repeat protein